MGTTTHLKNWYEKQVIPQIIRLGCGCQALAELRKPIVAQASGRVLELGIGAGANMPWFNPDQISEVIGIEPNEKLRDMARASPFAKGVNLSVVAAAGEELPFDDGSFDTVLCTFTLCSVRDHEQMLWEARRVLRSGGRFLFCEHGRAPDAGVARWQDRLDPVWSTVLGGCHLHRPVRGSIEKVFSIAGWQGNYQPKGPRALGWMESGVAV